MTLRLGKATAISNFASRGVCSRDGRLLLPLCICLLSLLAAGGVFVHNVLSLPPRTPILTLSGVYGPEWDLNCWVAEDLRCVGALRQGTFAIHELPEIDHLAGGFWDEADDTIRSALSSCDADVPLLVYVNLHGAVNDDGVACFVPPKASVNDASTWFPVYELLNRIEQLKVGHAKPATVLLLESGKIRSHWPAGITNNSFADRLEDVVDQHHRKHPDSQITILSSTARGQRSLASPHGDGNHFTRAVVAGLSGAADGRGKEKLVDGQVDSEELYRYVRQRVAESAEQQEVQQTPVVFQAGIESPLTLAQTMHSDPLKSLSSTAPPSSSELERLESVLQTVGEIGALNPIAVNPHAWAQVQRTTHGLLQSVSGGSAVRATKERWYSRLARQAESLRQDMSGQLTESSMLADLQADRHGKTIWSAIEKAPSRDAASAAIRDVDSEQAMPVPMLHAMLGRPDLAFWKSRDLIQRTAKTQVAWLQTKSVLPDGVFPAAETICEHIFEARRSLADAILADQSPAEIEQALVRFETEVARRCDELATLRTAWILRDRVYVELPFLIQWMDESSISVEQKDDASRGKISDVVALDALLTRFVGDTTTSKPPSMDEIAVASKRAAAFLGALTARREQERHSDEVTPSGESPCTERCQLIAAGPIRSANKSHSGDKKAAAFDSGCAECLSVLLGIESEEVTAKQRRGAVQSLAQTHAIDPDLDGQWRRVVSLIVDDDFANVIELSRRASRQQRLASRVNEVLDDFWYAPPAQNSPYFVATAKALIGLADSTADENPVWRTRKRDLTAKLESRHLASSKGLVIKATSQPSFDSEGTQLVSVHLNRANGQTDIPSGTANLVLRQKGSQHFSCERTVVIDPNDTKSLQLDVSLQAGRHQESLAELRFRGNYVSVGCDGF